MKTDQGNSGTEHHGIPRSESLKTSELNAAPTWCVLCKHSNRYFDEGSRRCGATWADFASCGCHCIFTPLQPDKLIRAAPALYTALTECLKQMRSAANLLEMFPDDYGDAINSGDWALALAHGQETDTSVSDGTT